MKLKSILVILIFSLEVIYAQAPGPKWINILELSGQTVYVDTSTIKQFSGQISVLSITVYKKAQSIVSLNKEASSVKSQILFNAALKKYSVIGTLYYDKDLKILGETSLPGFASSSDNFSVPIEGNEIMTAIFNKALEYLNSGVVPIDTQNTPPVKNDKKNEPVQTIPVVTKKVENIKPVISDTSSAFNRVALYLSKKDSAQKAITITELQKKNTPKTEEPKQNSVEQKQIKPGILSKDSENEVETNPKSTIFTDGSKYSFQVSSWKNKSKADSEVARLKGAGHNAFITEGLVRGATWYRVRIGYFNTLEAAEDYQKKIIEGK